VKELIAREIKPCEVIFFCVSYYLACNYFRCKREMKEKRRTVFNDVDTRIGLTLFALIS
jgi:hypothetical protein